MTLDAATTPKRTAIALVLHNEGGHKPAGGLDREYLIWLVGFFEGEGSCGCYLSEKRKGTRGQYTSYKLQMSVSQKDRQILDEIKATLECGSVTSTRLTGGRLADHEMWQWRCDSASARRILGLLQPLLRTDSKKLQVARALAKDFEFVRPMIPRSNVGQWLPRGA